MYSQCSVKRSLKLKFENACTKDIMYIKKLKFVYYQAFYIY